MRNKSHNNKLCPRYNPDICKYLNSDYCAFVRIDKKCLKNSLPKRKIKK